MKIDQAKSDAHRAELLAELDELEKVQAPIRAANRDRIEAATRKRLGLPEPGAVVATSAAAPVIETLEVAGTAPAVAAVVAGDPAKSSTSPAAATVADPQAAAEAAPAVAPAAVVVDAGDATKVDGAPQAK